MIRLILALFLAPAPVARAEPPPPREIQLRLDFRNLQSPRGEFALSTARARALFSQVNAVWMQCGIQFVLRKLDNEDAGKLGVPFPPQSQDDLSKIAHALDPQGYRAANAAIPLTIAGPWSFSNGAVYLNGLGWEFVGNDGGIDQIGAMMSAKKTDAPEAGLILAHELGHTLSLPEGGDGTLMGPGTPKLSGAQCAQARGFAEKYLSAFRAERPPVLAKR